MNEEETEIWKDIEGYEGLYKVSNFGNVLSLRHKKPKLLKPYNNGKGYLLVDLRNNNKPRKTISVHRIVAQAFLPNPNNYPVINHKDENPLNNNVNNLEFCTIYYNTHYGTAIDRMSKKLINRKDLSKPVLQFDKNKNLLNEYPSMNDAARNTGITVANISSVCKGKRKTAGGYVWRYKEN